MFLLFDIGGTNMRMATSDGQKIINSKIIPTPKNFDQGIDAFKQFAKGRNFKGVAGGIAGPLDREKTMLIASPHIPGWVGKPLKESLKKTFSCPVFLENDNVMTALGEASKGAGAGYNIVAYLGIGTGVGGARVVNGQLDENALGFEPGHQIIVPCGKPCHCGGKGHLEAYVGGKYLTKPVNWNEVAKYLAIGLSNTIVHWSPDIVVMGGSVMKSISFTALKKHLSEVLTIFPHHPLISLATLGHNAGFYGALTLLPSS